MTLQNIQTRSHNVQKEGKKHDHLECAKPFKRTQKHNVKWKSQFYLFCKHVKITHFFLQIKMKSRSTRSSSLWNSSLLPPLNDNPLPPFPPLPVAWLGTLLLHPFNFTTNLQISFIKFTKLRRFREVTCIGCRAGNLDIGTLDLNLILLPLHIGRFASCVFFFMWNGRMA